MPIGQFDAVLDRLTRRCHIIEFQGLPSAVIRYRTR